MPLKLPTTVKKFRQDDQVLQRGLDLLIDGVNGIINTLTGAFTFGDTTLTVLRQLMAPNGISTTTLTTTGAVTSGNGFKAVVGHWHYYTNAYPLGGQRGRYGATNDASTATVTVGYDWVAPYAGSVLAVSAQNSSSFATNTAVTVTVNGVTKGLVASMASTVVSGYATAAKGVIAFNAGDRIGTSFSYGSTAVNGSATIAFLVVEMAA